MRRFRPLLLCLLVAGCASAAPNAAELAAMQAAPKPSSEQAAEQAVQAYFQTKLIDPTAPLYRFPLPPTLAAVGFARARQAGWMMCGEVNSKNRMGGYTGFDQFFVYFSPTAPDTVVDGMIGDDDLSRDRVSGYCRDAYKAPAS